MNNKQLTPTYQRLWNRDFTLLTIAEAVLCMSCYATIPFMPRLLLGDGDITPTAAAMTMAVFVAGIFISGFFGSWLIQRFRRNKVCFISSLCLATAIAAIPLASDFLPARVDTTWAMMALCLYAGLAFGQAKRVLSCTLLTDKTESCHRTEANYAAIWTARLTLAASPLLAGCLRPLMSATAYHMTFAAAAVTSGLLVMGVRFPFRAPDEEVHMLSTDRFLLTKGLDVAAVIALATAALGIMMTAHANTMFYASLAAGFVTAMATLKYSVVRTGRYTAAAGNACVLAALAMMAWTEGPMHMTFKPMLLGIGLGLTLSVQIYRLLAQCDHCQRSTAESTYFMASDGGLFLGIATCHMMQGGHTHAALTLAAMAAIACALGATGKRKSTPRHA